MKVNQKKLARQLNIIDKWIARGCKGTCEAVTGFGKTYIAILIIQRIHAKHPDVGVDIVVPKIPLLDDWTDPIRGHIVKHGLWNVDVFVVNTYIKFERRFPLLLILDEVHNYASDEFGKVFKIAGVVPVMESTGITPYVLGLTATLERNDGKHRYIEEYCPVIDTVTAEEAKREGYISQYKIFNWGLDFNEEDKEKYHVVDTTFKNAFAKFNHNFELAMACSKASIFTSGLTVPVKVERIKNGVAVLIEEMTYLEKNSRGWQQWFAYQNGWDNTPDHPWSPSSVSKIAQQFSATMRARKLLIYKASVKIDAIEEIVNKYPKLKTITFSEDSEFADKVMERLTSERCRSYHSKIVGYKKRVEYLDKKGHLLYKEKRIGAKVHKEQILDSFKNGEYQVLSTVKAVDEGFDDPNVVIGVQASYTSAKRQDTQRSGRSSRLNDEDEDKVALQINLYMKNSQEEKWLKDKQRGKRDVEWVDSIDEIDFEEREDFSLV